MYEYSMWSLEMKSQRTENLGLENSEDSDTEWIEVKSRLWTQKDSIGHLWRKILSVSTHCRSHACLTPMSRGTI